MATRNPLPPASLTLGSLKLYTFGVGSPSNTTPLISPRKKSWCQVKALEFLEMLQVLEKLPKGKSWNIPKKLGRSPVFSLSAWLRHVSTASRRSELRPPTVASPRPGSSWSSQRCRRWWRPKVQEPRFLTKSMRNDGYLIMVEWLIND